MTRIWQQAENNQIAEDLAILQRDIGAVWPKGGIIKSQAIPSPSCPGFTTNEIQIAGQIINLLAAADAGGFRIGEAIMARMRLEEKLANAVG